MEKSHMPFLYMERHTGILYLFACKQLGGVWKLHRKRYLMDEEWVRVFTGLPDDVTECSPVLMEAPYGVLLSLTCVGGSEIGVRVVCMQGSTPDTLEPAVLFMKGFGGFVGLDGSVLYEKTGVIYVDSENGDRAELTLPEGYFIYRVSCNPLNRYVLYISCGKRNTEMITALEYNTVFKKEKSVLSDGIPAYKMSTYKGLLLYAKKVGETIDDREIIRAGVVSRLDSNLLKWEGAQYVRY
jgi:hypothetical protein